MARWFVGIVVAAVVGGKEHAGIAAAAVLVVTFVAATWRGVVMDLAFVADSFAVVVITFAVAFPTLLVLLEPAASSAVVGVADSVACRDLDFLVASLDQKTASASCSPLDPEGDLWYLAGFAFGA